MVLGNLVKFGDPRLNRSREIPPEAVGGGIFDGFLRDNFRQEITSDIISGVVVEHVGMHVPVKFVVILGQTVLEIFEPLTVLRTNERT